ncbi:DUF2169 family type VI secretion system accessory protein [Polyangium sorediatum]|uniref:DUF2169 domain-containing protein n=1 Tax=Polyangium sorediatum TaxID=889274 RepID=A0ABT6NPE6_9BACT|nr:DUF2169 domain-containing protein [Polyangium sorediatum]MDI1430153.1 DUF2169 domain-containing protein [Polyangium sorediatum]
MILRNYTPFPPLYFEARDVSGRDFGVLVLRGTFDMIPGAALRPNPKQRPIVEADVWHGEPNASSVHLESDLAPFKPRTDVMVNAVAHAPGGRPLPEWRARVEVGDIRKELRVTGPRSWVREGGEWRLRDPEPVAEVPIRYEHAFGGIWKGSWGEQQIFEENPMGVGFVGGEVPWGVDEVPAPQIESPEEPVVELGKPYRPEGFGPLARSWQPRLKRAGTFDAEWQRSRWPALPLDFEFSFYNASHPDLVAPGFLSGDEEVRLEGLSPEGAFSVFLPGYKLAILLRYKDGSMAAAPVFLDTVHVDVPAGQAHLVWRAPIPKGKTIRVLEPRMTIPGGGARG